MKKLWYRSAFVVISFLLVMGCDTVEEPVISYALCDTTDLKPSFNVEVSSVPTDKRKIFLEDYTGHTCGNCPEAALKAEELMATYGSDIVVVGVHAGNFAEPYPSGEKYRTDFRTEAGDAYAEKLGIDQNPSGGVNRQKFGITYYIKVDQWETEVQKASQLSKIADMSMKSTYNTERRVDLLDVTVKYESAYSGKCNLIIMLTESGIIDWQKDYTKSEPNVSDYEHNHVLRAVADNKAWGVEVNSASASAGEEYDFDFRICVDESWDENHMHLVGVLYDVDTYEVIQCEEISLLK